MKTHIDDFIEIVQHQAAATLSCCQDEAEKAETAFNHLKTEAEKSKVSPLLRLVIDRELKQLQDRKEEKSKAWHDSNDQQKQLVLDCITELDQHLQQWRRKVLLMP